MRAWKAWVWIALLLAACGRPPLPPAGPTAAPTAGLDAAGPVPGELVKFSGDTIGISEPFHLDVTSTVDITWEYAGSGPFALWLVNDTEELTDPSLFRVLIKQAEGASAETTQFRLEPGDYHLEVELAEGQWTVLARAVN
jgi:hypothetical protein